MINKSKFLKYILIFNVISIVVFSIIYSYMPPNNFIKSINSVNKLTYLDFLFYATTIQCTVGLPDITASTDLAKKIVLVHQIIVMGTTYMIISLFF